MLPSRDFKSLASTNFATRASGNRGGLAPPTVLFDPEALRTSASDRVLYSELGHPALAILIHPCAFGIKHKAQQMPTKKHLSISTPIKSGGWNRSRTGVHGFAGRCITTLPSSRDNA